MSRTFAANTDALQVANAFLTGVPFSLFCWMRQTNNANTLNFLIGVSGSANNRAGIGVNVTTLAAAAAVRDGSATSSANSTTGITLSAWNAVGGVFTSATDRAVYLNGGNKGTNTASRTAAGVNSLRIGSGFNSQFGMQGQMAHCAAWNIALSDADMLSLGTGTNPLNVHPEALVLYLPYVGRDSPEIDIIGGRTLTVTGATSSTEEPPITFP